MPCFTRSKTGLMPETVLYQGPSGVTIDATALDEELRAIKLRLVFKSAKEPPLTYRAGSEDFTVRAMEDEPWRAEVHPSDFPELLDFEEGNGPEKVEGVARLLSRVLPEPAKVIAHMPET